MPTVLSSHKDAEAQVASLRPFFILWGGQALSLIGSQSVQFAIVWWLNVETGSAAVLAAESFFALAPQVILGPLLGAFVDRHNRDQGALGPGTGNAARSIRSPTARVRIQAIDGRRSVQRGRRRLGARIAEALYALGRQAFARSTAFPKPSVVRTVSKSVGLLMRPAM
jgi:hypothetical protein